MASKKSSKTVVSPNSVRQTNAHPANKVNSGFEKTNCSEVDPSGSRRMKMEFRVPQSDPEPLLFSTFPTVHFYRPGRDASTGIHEERHKQRIAVTGAFPGHRNEAAVLVETIRDPENPEQLMFLLWQEGSATIRDHIEREGRIFLPPDASSNSFPLFSLPDGLLPCGNPAELLAETCSMISTFVKLRREHLLVVGTFLLASWFPDCFEAAPYLWVVGPLGSAKTKLLKLLCCLCRRGLIAGDLRSGSLYKLIDTWEPTLIIDELELGPYGANAELCRLLRSGSLPGVPTFRNGQRFSTYGLKVISSRQPLADTALLSRGLIINLLPTDDDLLPLDEAAMQQIAKQYQAKLLMFRLKNHMAVKKFRLPPNALQGLSPRTKQIARALTAPLLGDPASTAELLAIVGERDEEARIERSLEPEWLVAECLFSLVHEGLERGHLVSEILVGGVAASVNRELENQGEDLRLRARGAGTVLKTLGLRTDKLGRLGRGLKLTSSVKRKIHEIARQLGIDRWSIAFSGGLERGYGGAACSLCEELGLGGGLRFAEVNKSPKPPLRRSQPRPLYDDRMPANDENEPPAGEAEDNPT
jgi:hypothetical protein